MMESPTPSEQLHSELRTAAQQSFSSCRPVLTHLNADSSWLLSVPYPRSLDSPRERVYFHILIDPWLKGSQEDVASWFSSQTHAVDSAVQSIAEVERVVLGIENVARMAVEYGDSGSTCFKPKPAVQGPWIDAVMVSHEFTDHMHKGTLLELSRTVPIFATTAAAQKMRSWKYFEYVYEIPDFDGDWQTSSAELLPSFIGISRLSRPNDPLYYHSAVMVVFSNAGQPGEMAEALIYTPHGISVEGLRAVSLATPSIQTLALLHGLHDVKLPLFPGQLNLGARNGLEVQKLLKAKYWVGTHDEVKHGKGLISLILARKVITLEEAITEAATAEMMLPECNRTEDDREAGDASGQSVVVSDVNFRELDNGEGMILV